MTLSLPNQVVMKTIQLLLYYNYKKKKNLLIFNLYIFAIALPHSCKFGFFFSSYSPLYSSSFLILLMMCHWRSRSQSSREILMGCLCCRTFAKLQNLMSMERKLNQMTCIKLYKVAIDKKKKKKTRVKDYPNLDKASKSTKTNWM